jgi:3-hydroxymyristoyl/3-hydroxydecanoyl-(acyl carrier protein) dehydratase
VTADPESRHAATFRVPAQHPALAGHFPGNPVVPGVMVLDEVISAARSWLGVDYCLDRMAFAKFLVPLKPDETARIDLVLHASRLDFSVCRGSRIFAKGAFDLGRGQHR